jgi:hypothetical protein
MRVVVDSELSIQTCFGIIHFFYWLVYTPNDKIDTELNNLEWSPNLSSEKEGLTHHPLFLGFIMRIFRWSNSVFIWKLHRKVTLATSIKGVNYSGKYLSLDPSGMLAIEKDYAWNGCSPKFEVFEMVFGTPEGALPEDHEQQEIQDNLDSLGYTDFDWQMPKTYYGSLVHDALYQINNDQRGIVSRLEVDKLFYRILKAYNFLPAPLYYQVARLFGKLVWEKNEIIFK